MTVLKINEKDNVAVALADLPRGRSVGYAGGSITPLEDIPAGHKIALREISQGEEVIKYGFSIGKAQRKIEAGRWVHTHNLETGLDSIMHMSINMRLSAWKPGTAAELFPATGEKTGRWG